jgi:hypothetical protein
MSPGKVPGKLSSPSVGSNDGVSGWCFRLEDGSCSASTGMLSCWSCRIVCQPQKKYRNPPSASGDANGNFPGTGDLTSPSDDGKVPHQWMRDFTPVDPSLWRG